MSVGLLIHFFHSNLFSFYYPHNLLEKREHKAPVFLLLSKKQVFDKCSGSIKALFSFLFCIGGAGGI